MKDRIIATAALVVVAAFAGQADAGGRDVGLDQYVGGAGACQSALPAFDGLIRKRPLAIQNEGTAAAFVTCAPHQFVESDNFSLYVELINNGGAAATVSCTVVSRNGSAAPEYGTQSVEIPASGNESIRFDGFETGLDTYGLVRAVSCNLPPSTGITALEIDGDGTVYGGAP